MSAIVIILPTVRAEHADAAPSVVVTLKHRDFARLRKRANGWGVPTAEAAAAILTQALQPPRRPR
jgi:hypothetical protein